MVLAYIGIGLIIGLVIGTLFLDIDSVSKFFAKKEKDIDAKNE